MTKRIHMSTNDLLRYEQRQHRQPVWPLIIACAAGWLVWSGVDPDVVRANSQEMIHRAMNDARPLLDELNGYF